MVQRGDEIVQGAGDAKELNSAQRVVRHEMDLGMFFNSLLIRDPRWERALM